MAFYKKEPTAFTSGNKGQGPKPKKQENDGNKNSEKSTPNKTDLNCKSCGKNECQCSKVNDWQNKL